MKRLIFALVMMLAPSIALGQSFQPGKGPDDTNPAPVKLLCWNAGSYQPCPVSGGGAAALQGTYFATQPTLTDGAKNDLSLDASANLRVAVSSGAVVATVITNLGADNSASMTGLSVYARNSVYNGTNWFRQRGDQFGTYVIPKGSGNIATGQVSIGTTSTLVTAARSGRDEIALRVGAATQCAIGANGVTLTTGFPLQPTAGYEFRWRTYAAVYAVCASATTISFIENY